MTTETIAERIRIARVHRGWSQKELATRAGIHPVVLNRLEKGHKAGVQAETIRRLAEVLQVTSDYLLGLKDELESELEPTGVALVSA
jgi:transcriptional regulator with XRE-family HTH domain